ncbi:MAG: hypothetical protein IIA44_16275, partial [Acidobacteria bacterium]|nr:hypothetical protein [Acidobacteriota bacterium]
MGCQVIGHALVLEVSMHHHVRPVFAALAALAAVSVLGTAPATAQTEGWTPPRAADGRVDLQGVWANNAATPLERPDSLADKATFTDEELARLQASAQRLFGGADDAAFGDGVFNAVLADIDQNVSGDGGTGNYSSVWMVDREFENRTSLITDPPDGKLPALTPAADARIEVAAEYRRTHPADGPEDLTRQVRCITYGIPRVGGLGAGYNSYYQIFQTPDYFVMLGEMIHDARVIPIGDTPHIGDSVRQWHGDSRAHWEGDTLVVETTNYSPKSDYRGAAEHLHLIERFTLAGPDKLHYEITVTDATTWTRPWTAMVPLSRSEDALFEYACHEGNIGMAGIL